MEKKIKKKFPKLTIKPGKGIPKDIELSQEQTKWWLNVFIYGQRGITLIEIEKSDYHFKKLYKIFSGICSQNKTITFI